MPQVFPFRPLHYPAPTTQGGAAGDISSKVAPPYDVLDAADKAALLARDPHNIVAIDLPHVPPKELGPKAAYAAAAETLQAWAC